MAGVSPAGAAAIVTHTPSRAYRVGRTEFITEEITTMGLSAEVCESFVKDCINVKQLQRLAAAIDARLVALDAKSKAQAAKRAKASK
jgi:hypothetical protein